MKTNDRLAGRKTLHVSGLLEEIAVEEVKAHVDLVELFGRYGVELKAQGKSFVGCCPWHEDHTPSLSVDREKGLYHCFGCGESGDAVSLTEKMLGVGFKDAVAELKAQSGSRSPIIAKRANGETKKNDAQPPPTRAEPPPPRHSTEASGVPSSVSLDEVAVHYEKQLASSAQGRAYLERRGLASRELWTRFRLGFCGGSLRALLSANQVEELKAAGVLSAKGAEQLVGCLTVPLFDAAGRVVGFYGRAIDDAHEPKHRYLAGPHRGLVNRKAARVYREKLLLTESVLDALSLIQLGIENVIPCYGVNGFTEEHRKLLIEERVAAVVVAFDADEAGVSGSAKLAESLRSLGLATAELTPLQGKDWNDYLAAGGTRESIAALLAELPMVAGSHTSEPFDEVRREAGRTVFRAGELSYRVAGVKELFIASLRVNIRVLTGEATYIDNAELYSARSRSLFAQNAARLLSLESSRIERDLVAILEHLEAERDRSFRETEVEQELSAEEREAGMQLLTDPRLPERIVADLERLGYVGEEVNKLLVYLAATSRKTDDPLSVLVVSESASGKSYLIETVARLMPPSEVVSVTSLSDQALNYMSEDGLLHKFLILGEAVHSESVEHQVREMLSAGELSRLVTMKDPRSGELESRRVRKRVVVSVAMSSTTYELNPENASRFFVVNTDESVEQTRRIHEAQRRKYSVERYTEGEREADLIIRAHRAAQRLLKARLIVNPFAEALSFPDTLMRSRRDHERFLDLIAAVCFLRQFQKEEHEGRSASGEPVRYIECDLEDHRVAETLMREVLPATTSSFPPSARRLYTAVRAYCETRARESGVPPDEVSFTQRSLREATGFAHEWLKLYLRKLVEWEYLERVGSSVRGSRGRYRLARGALLPSGSAGVPSLERVATRLATGKSGESLSPLANSQNDNELGQSGESG